MLGLDVADLGERPLWMSTGNEQMLVPLASEDAVRRARPYPNWPPAGPTIAAW